MTRASVGLVVAATFAITFGVWWRLGLSWPPPAPLIGAVSLVCLTLGLRYFVLRPNRSAPSPDARPTLGGTPGNKKAATSTSERHPPRVTDDVWCTAFSPSTCAPGDTVLVQVFAHRRAHAAKVRKMAVDFDSSANARGASRLDSPVERGSELIFCLAMKHAVVEPTMLTLVWHGEPSAVQFSVSVPEDWVGNNLIGTIYVTHGSIPFGHLKFIIHVAAADLPDRAPAERQPADFRQYRSAFVSYASPDRTEVLKRVQMLARLSIHYFQDLMSLDPGDRWERELYRNIDQSDVFFLFWSTHARNSTWVLKEVQYAIQRKGGDECAAPEIVPIIIEGPPPVPPPPELAHLHFNDKFMYFM